LVALRAGDPRPFEDFVRGHARVYRTYFLRQGARPDEAEDLAQDVFLRLYREAPRYRPEERLVAFGFRIARNLWIDSCRRRAAAPVSVPLESTPAPAFEAPPGAGLEQREDEARLLAAVARLSPEQRSVLELAAIEGLSYAEIGRVLDVPEGTVKSRMFYAVRALRELLAAPQVGRA
jgi:RNA polymerase sigma-70 factor (ECF subfamily)